MSKLSGIRSAESSTGPNKAVSVQALTIHVSNGRRTARSISLRAEGSWQQFYRWRFKRGGRKDYSTKRARRGHGNVVRAEGVEPSQAF